MPEKVTVTVTRAQRTAARYALSRSSTSGHDLPESVAKIARATSSSGPGAAELERTG